MQQQNECHSSTEAPSIADKKEALTTLMSSNRLTPQQKINFFKALKFPIANLPNQTEQDRKNGIVIAIYKRLKRAKQKNRKIEISVSGYIKYEFSFLFNPTDHKTIHWLKTFFYNFLKGCSKEVRELLLKKIKKPIKVAEAILKKMNINLKEGWDCTQFGTAILANARSAFTDREFSFYEFLAYDVYMPKKEPGCEPTDAEIAKARRAGSNADGVIKNWVKGSPAEPMLYNGFSRNVAAFQMRERINTQEPLNKHLRLSEVEYKTLEAQKDNSSVSPVKPLQNSSNSINLLKNMGWNMQFWRAPRSIPQTILQTFEEANYEASTKERFKDASFLNDLSLEDFLCVSQARPTVFEQSQVSETFKTIRSDKQQESIDEISKTFFGNNFR